MITRSGNYAPQSNLSAVRVAKEMERQQADNKQMILLLVVLAILFFMSRGKRD